MNDQGNWRHICVDAQRMFSEDTPCRVPWMSRVLPQLQDARDRHADRAIVTRIIPPVRPDDAAGSWNDYYRKWWMMTCKHLPQELLRLAPSTSSGSTRPHFRQGDVFAVGGWQAVFNA